MPGERLGQNFLVDAGWRSKIVQSLPLRWGDTWIEIGAGRGEITQLIAKQVKQVIAIELDANLAAGLRRNTAGSGKIEIIEGDVLTVPFAALFARIDTPIRIYGSLPYYITSPILHHLFRWADRIASIDIVIQLEVAERIAAKPGNRDYGYLSTICQFYTHPKIAFRIPPGAFRPPPKVQSALVKMALPGESSALAIAAPEKFFGFLQLCFALKRKTLRNNLLGATSDDRIHEALENAGARSDARAEQLSLSQFAVIFKSISR